MGERDSWALINYLRRPTPQERENLFDDFDKIPFGQILAATFKTHTDEESWMIGRGIAGNVRNLGDEEASMILTLDPGNEAALHIYRGPVEEIPESMGIVGAADEKVTILARAQKAGVWRIDKGNLKRWAMSVWFRERISLPTKFGKWLFGMLAEFSQTASEFYDPLKEQPTFWDRKPPEL